MEIFGLVMSLILILDPVHFPSVRMARIVHFYTHMENHMTDQNPPMRRWEENVEVVSGMQSFRSLLLVKLVGYFRFS